MKCRLFCHLIAGFFVAAACSSRHNIIIQLREDAGKLEWLAAREIRKYVYLRTDELPEIQKKNSDKSKGFAIILKIDSTLEAQEFRLKTTDSGGSKTLIISGGSEQSVLYGSYEFAEKLGVRFYLHGDVIPDLKITCDIPDLDIHKKPLFNLRGILPFHDFPEGPDWWNEEDYKSIIAQLPKLKMNFIGFHCYPYRPDFDGQNYKAEPLVWIGSKDEVNADGTVRSAYPVLYFHTQDSTWGYFPAHTSEFLSGASQLFETDNYGPDYMKGISPWPHSDDENTAIFNQSGKVFSSAFELARSLGVKTCVGTESPLIIPGPVKKKYGIGSDEESMVKELYRGIFSRIQKTYPLDYYWLWTPEYWTWKGVEDKEVLKTERDMQIAHEVLKEMGSPFNLATCGWVLGPPKDRTEFDRILPKDIPFSCINRGLGYTPVDKGFGSVYGRPKWSIPWMEDDPALLTAQLWAGRMRRDALDSWKYGCDGLFGIHWRTRILAPTVSALSMAAWECDKYDASLTGRDLPVEDFYADWVKTEFGVEDPRLVNIFVSLDGKGVESKEGYKGDAPLNATDWILGPGALMVNRDMKDIQERITRYDFLTELENIRNHIEGKGNLERFDYWLNAFRFNKAVLEATLTQIEFNKIMERIKSEVNPENKSAIAKNEALPKRIELARKWENMNRILLAFTSTTGEMGTIANLEMHNIRRLGNLTGHDEFLRSVLGVDLPQEVRIPETYSGKTKIITSSGESVLQHGKDFYLRVRILSESDILSVRIYYRILGAKKYFNSVLNPLSSNVFDVNIPASLIEEDFEYFIEVETENAKVRYPVTAGDINCVVVHV